MQSVAQVSGQGWWEGLVQVALHRPPHSCQPDTRICLLSTEPPAPTYTACPLSHSPHGAQHGEEGLADCRPGGQWCVGQVVGWGRGGDGVGGAKQGALSCTRLTTKPTQHKPQPRPSTLTNEREQKVDCLGEEGARRTGSLMIRYNQKAVGQAPRRLQVPQSTNRHADGTQSAPPTSPLCEAEAPTTPTPHTAPRQSGHTNHSSGHAGGAGLQRLNLRRHQPAQRPCLNRGRRQTESESQKAPASPAAWFSIHRGRRQRRMSAGWAQHPAQQRLERAPGQQPGNHRPAPGDHCLCEHTPRVCNYAASHREHNRSQAPALLALLTPRPGEACHKHADDDLSRGGEQGGGSGVQGGHR